MRVGSEGTRLPLPFASIPGGERRFALSRPPPPWLERFRCRSRTRAAAAAAAAEAGRLAVASLPPVALPALPPPAVLAPALPPLAVLAPTARPVAAVLLPAALRGGFACCLACGFTLACGFPFAFA